MLNAHDVLPIVLHVNNGSLHCFRNYYSTYVIYTFLCVFIRVKYQCELHIIIHIVLSSLQRQWVMTSISLGVLFCCIKYSISFYFEWKGLLFVLLDIKRPLGWLQQFIFWHDTQKFSLDSLLGSSQNEYSGLKNAS